MQTGRNEGMMTFESYVNDLISRGMLSRKEGNEFLGKKSDAGAPANGSPASGGTHSGINPVQNTNATQPKVIAGGPPPNNPVARPGLSPIKKSS
jgi:hypothetical protein